MSSISDQLSSYSKSTGPRAKGFRLGATVDLSRISQLGCGGRCCKFSLLGLACFIVVSAIGILAGAAYCVANLEIVTVIGKDFTNAIFAFGIVLLIVGSLGVGGAMTENRMVLAIFLACLAIMVLVLLIFGAWTLSNLGKESVILGRAWQSMDNDEHKTIQFAYNCCGPLYKQADPVNCPLMCPTDPSCVACFPLMITDFRNLYTTFGVIFILFSGVLLATLVTAFFLMRSVAGAQEEQAAKKGRGRGGRV